MNLEQQVKHLDKHYRDGNPIVSDKKFDILEKKLYEMHPDSDYFTNRDALPLPSLEKDPIEDLYAQIGELNRVWNEQELELTTKEYICKFDELKQRIHELEK